MSSLPATVAETYRYIVGVDTHAATHSYAIVCAPNGALIDQASFGGFKRWAQGTLRVSLMVSDSPASCGGVR